MREFIKNYKVWVTVSITLIIMLISICISFSGNYHELEDLRTTHYENSEQKQMITQLREENYDLKTENDSHNQANSIETIIREYVKVFFNTDGTESNNEKAIQIRKYVTEKIYEQMYDDKEKPATATNDAILQTGSVENITYQILDPSKAKGYATINVSYVFPDEDEETERKTIILQMDFQYDSENSIWKIESVESSIINLRKVWG